MRVSSACVLFFYVPFFSKAMYPYISGDSPVSADNECEEPLMFCLNGEEDEEGPPGAQSSESDRVYANAMLVDQVDDVDIKYRSPGQEEEEDEEEEEGGEEGEGGRPRLASRRSRRPAPPSPSLPRENRNGEGPPACLQPPCRAQPGGGTPSSPRVTPRSPVASSPAFPSSPLASAFRLFEGHRQAGRRGLPVSPGLHHRGVSLPETTRGLSPSVECDSGEEDILGRSYPVVCPRQQQPSAPARDKDSGFGALQDLSRTFSDSTPKSAQQHQEEAEGRLRSYSYSSPKAKPSRPLLNRDVSDLAEEQRAFSLTETTRDKRIEDEEEWDKYIIPSKVESEKYKVSRTFSFLKSKMSSTRSKTKVKGKEVKEKEKPGASNGHQFVAPSSGGAALPGPAACVACDRPVPGKDLLQCSICSLSVHKSCRDAVSACGKKPQDKKAVSMKSKASTLPQNSAKDTSSLFSSSPSSSSSSSSTSTSTSSSLTAATREKRETAALSKSLSISTDCSRRLSDIVVVDGEGLVAPLVRSALCEETMQTTPAPPSTTDPPATTTPSTTTTTTTTTTTSTSATEEPVDSPLLSDLSPDLLGLQAESWSLAVSLEFCRRHDKRTVKRQDVIYELMQTELHHIQTLSVMAEVFRRGMLEELQLDVDCVARLFPCLDPLLLFHRGLFGALQERRQASAQARQPRDYLLQRMGDILLQQVRDIITAVDVSVSRYEKGQELQEVLGRLENKSLAKLKNDKVFRKQDLARPQRVLQHKGLDQKPPVIPLQKLIVREVANEERGMFLISASSVGPEMYEVHTATREERNAWMRHIRHAVESCPEEEEEEERSTESEEARRASDARVQKIQKL
ncbi:hypothetical protein CRUP_036369, partial [Coryphaenoides rupestris]